LLEAVSEKPSPPVSKLTTTKLFVCTMWHRLIGTSVGWLVWDVAFDGMLLWHASDCGLTLCNVTVIDSRVAIIVLAGNKLFQGKFIAALYDNPTVFVTMQWTLLNSAIAWAGKPGLRT
jgi:hypothetical protein